MDFKMLAMMNRLRKVSPFSETLIGKFTWTSRSYQTNVKDNKKVTLYSKISPLGNPNLTLSPELDDWIEKGNKVRFAELQRIVKDLRKRRRYSQALEVSEWMSKKGVCTFTPIEHAVQLDLIGKVNGFLSAEKYFNDLRDQDKTEKTYGALLHCYVRQRQTDKCLSHLQKMKEMGFTLSSLTYNDIMCLYTYTGQNEKVRSVLNEMKKNGVSPDNLSYRICINSYRDREDIEEVENILKEMENRPDIVIDWNTYAVVANFYINIGLIDKANDALKKAEEKLVGMDNTGYNHLISLHARLTNKADVLRLWDLEKSACKRCINKDYITMLKSFVKLNEFEEADKLLKEWESSGNCYDFQVPHTVIAGCIDKGLYDKAKAILDHLTEKGKATRDNWGTVAKGYVKKGEMEKAIDCMRAAFSLPVESEGWKPDPNAVTCSLDWLGEKGSAEEAESFVGLIRNVIPVNKKMYLTLIKAYIRGRKEVGRLLDSMKADKIDEDEEIKKILSKEEKKV